MTALRAFCLVLYYAFARHLPSSTYKCFRWVRWCRYITCKPLFKKCGKSVNIEKGAFFGIGHEIEIGDYSGIGINCRLHGPVKIGRNGMMGPEVVIISTSHRFDNLDVPMAKQGYGPPKQVVIGDDVWIGTRAIILSGVNVGNHSIIGAGSVVTKDVPDWAIAAGNPARVIRYRTDDKNSKTNADIIG